MKYLLRKCEMFADANVANFISHCDQRKQYFTIHEVNYFTFCGRQNISLKTQVEFITIGIAISTGEREFDTIVAVHDQAPNCLVAPCGNCRQMLIEYCPNIKVILNDDNNKMIKVSIKDLIPFAWKPVIV